ncbi:MAG TPA: hypothetical protein VK838_00720 [Candidatus Limnocylindrales bacterium]|nr:hypothetical protein [Candidatus Limnocylindrales bacterium]
MPSPPDGPTTPRTISGQALLSGLRPHVKRGFGPTVLAIETEAAAPYADALAEAERVLADLAARDPAQAWEEATRADLVERARLALDLTRALPGVDR